MPKPQTELLDPAKRTAVLQFELDRIRQLRATPLEEVVRWLRAKEHGYRDKSLYELSAKPPLDAGQGMYGLGHIAGTTELYRELTTFLEGLLEERKAEKLAESASESDEEVQEEPNGLEQELIDEGTIDPRSKKGSLV